MTKFIYFLIKYTNFYRKSELNHQPNISVSLFTGTPALHPLSFSTKSLSRSETCTKITSSPSLAGARWHPFYLSTQKIRYKTSFKITPTRKATAPCLLAETISSGGVVVGGCNVRWGLLRSKGVIKKGKVYGVAWCGTINESLRVTS